MTAHVLEEDLVKSLSQRAFMVGILMGTLHTVRQILKEDRPEIVRAIDERLESIYPLVDQEFYSHLPEAVRPQANEEKKSE